MDSLPRASSSAVLKRVAVALALSFLVVALLEQQEAPNVDTAVSQLRLLGDEHSGTLKWYGRSTAHAYHSKYSWSYTDAKNFCAAQEKRLCKRDEYCPHGPGNEPIGGAKSGHSWAAAGDGPHTWVQVGVWRGDRSKTCQTHAEAFASTPDDFWKSEMGAGYFQWIACCSNEEETDNSERLPRIVHQSYKTTELPTSYKTWRDHCIELNPDWEFRLWTDEDNRKLVEEDYPELLKVYDGYDVNIKRIDMVRYLYLHKYGGVYMDMDVACLSPFESEFDTTPHFVVAPDSPGGGSFPNAFMVSTPGHPILERILKALPTTMYYSVLAATGPAFLTDQLRAGDPSEYRVLPMEMIYGESWADGGHKCRSIAQCKEKYPDALTVSFWTRSWTGNSKNLETGF